MNRYEIATICMLVALIVMALSPTPCHCCPADSYWRKANDEVPAALPPENAP